MLHLSFVLTHQPASPSLWAGDAPVPESSPVLLGDLDSDGDIRAHF